MRHYEPISLEMAELSELFGLGLSCSLIDSRGTSEMLVSEGRACFGAIEKLIVSTATSLSRSGVVSW